MDVPVETLETGMGRLLPQQCEIFQMINNIIRFDCLVPNLNQPYIHLGCSCKTSLAVLDHIVMTEMRIGGKPDRHP